jgi:hypothetical protein
MKTKHYEFTQSEIFTLREALIDYWQSIKKLNPQGVCGIENKYNAEQLKERFKQDMLLINLQ